MSVSSLLATLLDLCGGLPLTILLSIFAIVGGLAVGIGVAILQLRGTRPIRWLANGYVQSFRGTPLLLQVYLVYFGPGQFEAVRRSPLWIVLEHPFWCATLALALNSGAYTCEIFRGAVLAIPNGQIDAARAFGLRRRTMVMRIVAPQALRIAFPVYASEMVQLVKATSIASVVTLIDVTGRASLLAARTYRPVEVMAAAGILYAILVSTLLWLLSRLERRIDRQGSGIRASAPATGTPR